MFKGIFCFLFFVISINEILFAQHALKPFPQHVVYFNSHIRPNHVPQQKLDEAVTNFYNEWKKKYVITKCNANESYIWFDKNAENKSCVSEGQGYGMMIIALMAGYDTSCQNIFDRLYNYYRSHPSSRSPWLMAWAQLEGCKDVDKSSATDGDMDIAYSLLLADKQWTSKGKINYLKEAKKIIKAISEQEINHKTYSILLSNSVETDSKDYYDMRSSDFMPTHLKSFLKISGDSTFRLAVDDNYILFQQLQKRFSEDAGLVPDFIKNIHGNFKPAGKNYLESKFDGYYNYNACRVPWRIGIDYLLTGDKRAKDFLEKINKWIKETTLENPDNISAGYTLSGDDLHNRYFEALSFIAPFAVSAMIDKKNQQWLNKLWDYITNFKAEDFDYYDNSIKLICLLVISGNYWMP